MKSSDNLQAKLTQQAQSLPVPASTTPTADSLLQRANRRRGKRKLTIGSIAMTLGCICTFAVLQNSVTDSETQLAVSDGEPSARQIVRTPETIPDQFNDLPNVRPESTSPEVRLFARVRQPVPVFELDEQTNQLQYVGWLEKQRRIPVDWQHVPSEDRPRYERALYKPVKYEL